MSAPARLKHHAPNCHVDGGTGYDRRRGFVCPKCRQLDTDSYEEGLLVELDKYAGAGR